MGPVGAKGLDVRGTARSWVGVPSAPLRGGVLRRVSNPVAERRLPVDLRLARRPPVVREPRQLLVWVVPRPLGELPQRRGHGKADRQLGGAGAHRAPLRNLLFSGYGYGNGNGGCFC